MVGNAVIVKQVGLAGTFHYFPAGERVRISNPDNLPNEGRDWHGKKRWFAVNRDGIAILVYAEEFRLDIDKGE